MWTSRTRPKAATQQPHHRRARWLPGDWLAEQLGERQADAGLAADLDRLSGQTIDEL